MHRFRVCLALLALGLLAAPGAASAAPLSFGEPTTIATGVESPTIAAYGGAARLAWISRAVGEEDRIVTAELPKDGSTGEQQTLATSVSNGIGQPSTYLSPPQVAAASANSSAVLWGEVTTGGPAGTDASTFGVSRFISDETAPPARPDGRVGSSLLAVDADRQVVVVWHTSGGLTMADVGIAGALENTREVVATGGRRIQAVGVVDVSIHSYLVFETLRDGAVRSVSAVRVDTANPGPVKPILRSSASRSYSDAMVAGDRVYAFERASGMASLVAADPRKRGSVRRLAEIPGGGTPLGLNGSSLYAHSGAALSWTTSDREVFAAVAGRRKAKVLLLTPGRRDGRGPDVALDARGRSTIVWRDGPNGRRDQILAVQLSRAGKPGPVTSVSAGSRGLAPQVVSGPGGSPEVIWNEKGGELKLARDDR